MSAMGFGFVFKAWSFNYINTTLLLRCVYELRESEQRQREESESEWAHSSVAHYWSIKWEVGKVRTHRRRAGGGGKRLLQGAGASS